MGFLGKMFSWLPFDGKKSIIAYILTQIPFLTENPLLLEAIQNAIENPTPAALANAFAHVLLAVGIFHKAIKLVNGE